MLPENESNMNWIFWIIIAVAVLVIIQAIRQWRKKTADYALLSERVHYLQTNTYAFMIDRNFKVKETNFYELNENIKDDQPYVLGNVLHCQDGCDSGLCGTGISCGTCPIRMVVNNAFKLRRSFDHVEATMHLYDANHEVKQENVIMDGELVYVGREPHLLVKVRKTI